MSETWGECRSEMEKKGFHGLTANVLADAIDRLAADVAEIKAAVCDGSVAEARDRFFARWAATLNERDKLRAEIEKLKAELAARQADGNSPKTLDSSPAAPQPAAPEARWLTAEERELLQSRSRALRCWLFARLPPPTEVTREVKIIDALLSRAGSPPVVEVPAMSSATYGFDSPFSSGEYRAGYRQACLTHRAAMDRAGVKWKEKEVGRE